MICDAGGVYDSCCAHEVEGAFGLLRCLRNSLLLRVYDCEKLKKETC